MANSAAIMFFISLSLTMLVFHMYFITIAKILRKSEKVFLPTWDWPIVIMPLSWAIFLYLIS
jgi:hypothetical protein